MALFSITAKAAGWKGVIAALKNSNEEASFRVTNEGVRFYGAPPGNWFIVSMLWERENLDELTLDAEKTVGFRTDDADKIFKRFASDDVVTISMKQEGLLCIKSQNRSWDLRTISPEMINELKEPNIKHTISFLVNPAQLKDMLADVAVFSKNTHFVSDGKLVYLESVDDSGKAKTRFTNITTAEIADSEYSLEYIGDVMSAVYLLSESIRISFSHQKPLLLEFEIINAGILRYHLAPLAVK